MSLGNDVRYALRMVRQRPGFSALAVVVVALGVGANSAVFSLVDAALLSPLPFPAPERLVFVSSVDNARGAVGSVSFPDFLDWSEQSESFEALAAFQEDSFIISGRDVAERVRGEVVTPEYFRLLGVEPLRGRAIAEDEREPVVVLSEALVERRFGDTTEIVGRTIELNDLSFVVIGVVPAAFQGITGQARLWVPMSLFDVLNPELVQYDILGNRGTRWHAVLGRLVDGVALGEARAEMDTLASALAETYPRSNEMRGVQLLRAQDEVVSDYRSSLWLLSAAVGLLLLLACVNLANLFLLRVLSRRNEVSVRIALGANRAHLVRQLLTETALFSLVGGALGLLVAHLSIQFLLAFAPDSFPIANVAVVDARVFVFAFALSAVAGIACGLFPALTAASDGLVDLLREGARSGFGRRRALGVFALAEIAIATLLLVGAGLVLKSFHKMQLFEPGFATDHLVTMRFHVPADASDERFLEGMVDEIARLPGVTSAAIASHVYFGGGYMSGNVTVEGFEPASPAEEVKAYHHFVTDDYFRAMGIPLVHGERLGASEHVVVVNESFAKRMWPNEKAEEVIGKRLVRGPKREDEPWLTIVGVVGNVESRLRPTAADRLPQFYFSMDEGGEWSRSLVVRTSVDPASVAGSVRASLRQLHQGIAVFSVATMDELLSRQRASMRSVAYLMGGFAALALLLAALGLYGVIAYAVGQLTHEIGVRVAIGATRGSVVGLVMKRAVVIIGAGLAVGVVASFAATRFAAALLYQVDPLDARTFVAVAAGMTGVVLLASYVPARRAADADPVAALRR